MLDPRQRSVPVWTIRSVAVRSRDGPQRVAQVYRRLLAPPQCDRADGDAITPALNLADGQPMRGGRLANLNLQLSSRRDRIRPPAVPQRRDAERCGLINRFGRYLD